MEARCRTLAKGVEGELGLGAGQVAFFVEDFGSDRYVALGGQASEFAERNSGKRHRVLECSRLGEGIYSWIGFQEQWRRASGRKRMEFVRGSFTAHVGRRGEVEKPQILRKEWVGRGSELYREDVGQPHWQLDILESLRSSIRSAREELDIAFSEEEERVMEFPAGRYKQRISEVFAGIPIERMHLASAARLWDERLGQLATSPSKVEELDRWMLHSLRYIRQELARCTFSSSARQ